MFKGVLGFTILGFVIGVFLHQDIVLLWTPYRAAIMSGFTFMMFGFFASVTLNAIYTLFGQKSFDHHHKEVGKAIMVQDAVYKHPISEGRQRNVSVHEAGHILALGFYETRPDSLNAVIKETQDGEAVGYINFRYNDNFQNSKAGIESILKLYLAGGVAEDLIFGERRVGVQSDMRDWEMTSKAYLACYPGGKIWFNSADTRAEALINAETLKTFRLEQEGEVLAYLQERKDLLVETADLLFREKNLEKEDLFSFVDRSIKQGD
jgi:ATP-dependent Zn protease